MTTFVADAGAAADLREIVGGIWLEMLAIEHLVEDDDFFKLGGDSLLASEVVLRLEEMLGLSLDSADLFDHPTFSAFLQQVARHSRASARAEMVEGGF